LRTFMEKLRAFKSIEVDTADFVPSLDSLIQDLAQHFNEVEMADLPALDSVIVSYLREKVRA